MIDINTIENVLMTLTFIFLGLYGIAHLIDLKPNWFLSKTLLKCKKI